MDDGSRDEGPAMVEAIAAEDPRVVLLRLPAPGQGLVAALNYGLVAARAPMLARMDADDICHPERLQLQHRELARRPDLFAVSCRVEGFPRSDCGEGMRRYLDWQNGLVTSQEISRERFVESPVLHPSLMLRSEPLRQVLGGWRDQGWPEDWDLVLRAHEAGLSFARIRRVLLAWRNHETQYTRQDSRCSAQAFAAARAHFLSRHLAREVPSERPIVVFGAGPVGKLLAKGLAAEGLLVSAFYEVSPKKIGNTVAIPSKFASPGRQHWPVLDSKLLASTQPRPFGLAAVGQPGGRARVREACLQWGWQEFTDFLVVA